MKQSGAAQPINANLIVTYTIRVNYLDLFSPCSTLLCFALLGPNTFRANGLVELSSIIRLIIFFFALLALKAV
jgi:hypothetical protein